MTFNRRTVLSGGMAAAAAGIAARSARADDGKVHTLRFQGSHPPNQAFTTVTAQGFRELVETMSAGRIKFEVYDAGALVSVTEMLDAVDQGLLDVMQSYGAFYSGSVPEADIEVGLPTAWKHPWEAYDAYYERGLLEIIREAYESRFNVRYFPAVISLTYGLALRDEIGSLAELEGKKIRALGVYGDFVQRLGGAPVVIPGAELYTAMQLGTIDGVLYGAEAVAAANLQDFCKSMIYQPNWNTGVGQFVFNAGVFDALPEDLRQVIDFAARYGGAAQAMAYSAAEAQKMKVLTDAGMKMLQLTPEDEARLAETAQAAWDAVAAKSDLAARGVELVRTQRRELDAA
ncbi:MAG: TRAP transporter substrate-binding protein DctP [Albimonas sp.]|uniref:TRAP transporter substrate-binding protein DctP n=1 Tax=Albimonas sp. TaxID=1872425 RepID=UPI004057594B